MAVRNRLVAGWPPAVKRQTWIWMLLAALVGMAAWASRLDVSALGGKHKGDEATFVSMAYSLAIDGDLRFTKTDLNRFVEIFGYGPEGVFLKRGHDIDFHWHARWPPLDITREPVPANVSLEYGKSYLHAVVAAPFVAAFGLGGLALLNGLLLGISVACAVAFARARCGPVAGTIVGLSFFLATIVPVYTVWLTPEVLNVTLVCTAYFLWLYKEVAPNASRRWHGRWTDWVAALLIGLATFSKPTHAPLIAPLLCYAWWQRRWGRSAAITALFLLGSVGNFGLNALVSGEWNYQGGDRKSFYSHFPFESPQATFDTLGNQMATDETEAEDLLAPQTLLPLLKHNAPYFLFGQNAGLFPYFFPGALIGVAFLYHWRRAAFWQWLAFLACSGAALILIVLTPYSWSGGGGPVGNRYYLSIYPVLLFLLPAGLQLSRAIVMAVVGLVFMGGVVVRPVAASLSPWTIGEQWPLRYLPIELTLLDDLPVRLNPNRGRIPFWIESFVYLYYMDGNSYSPEPAGGVPGAPTDGFWIAGDRTARIAIRSRQPLTRVQLTVKSRQPNTFTVSIGGRGATVELAPEQSASIHLTPDAGVHVGHSYAYVLTMTTTAGFVPVESGTGEADDRNLGVFVKPVFRVQPYAVR